MYANSEVLLASTQLSPDRWTTRLSVPTMHCGGCISKVETALMQLDAVSAARVNLTRKFVDVVWSGSNAPNLIDAVSKAGHNAHVQVEHESPRTAAKTELIRSVAVAGFAASNIMLMSAAIWAGADAGLKDLFHWLSAAIALPTLFYSGRVFFRSAWMALRHLQTNMDVPISIGVILAFSMSLYDTIHGQGAVYFEASVMLLFFLLIGRALDHAMREKTQNAIAGLAKLVPNGATIIEDGETTFKDLQHIEVGETLLVAAGERVPLDGKVNKGASYLDCSIVTGESKPQSVQVGTAVIAGTLNLNSNLEITVTANRDQSFLSKTMEMMSNVTSSRSKHRRISDRAAQLYAPFVHSVAFLSFVGWMAMTGDWHRSLTIAIAVLIITCPCALGLAAPIVQVVAAQKLFSHGVLARDGTALERMQDVDAIVFDKTGTLTQGNPTLCNRDAVDPRHLSFAAALTVDSMHPFSRALRESIEPIVEHRFDASSIEEVSGFGIQAMIDGKLYRLGQSSWALSQANSSESNAEYSEATLSCDGELLETFYFEDSIRSSAKPALNRLLETTPHITMLSGDRERPVQRTAEALQIKNYRASCLPSEKLAQIERMTSNGRKVLMVGDGLNDAPALAAAHVSMAPSSAADIGRNNADFVFLIGDLMSIPRTFKTTKTAGRLISQNFAFAMVYNLVAVPFAILGFVTPMIAAIAMSGSSIIVVLNAFRLNLDAPPENHAIGKSQ